MTSNQRNWTTIGVTLGIGGVVIAGYLQYAGVSDDSLRMYLHLGLIAYRFGTSSEINLDASAIFGGIAYALIGLMIITSFDVAVRALGPRRWQQLHKVGIYIVALPFVSTLLPETRDQLFKPGMTYPRVLARALV